MNRVGLLLFHGCDAEASSSFLLFFFFFLLLLLLLLLWSSSLSLLWWFSFILVVVVIAVGVALGNSTIVSHFASGVPTGCVSIT